MKIYETVKDKFIISTDIQKLDINVIHDFLCNESYWAKNISFQIVEQRIKNSFCFGVYTNENINKQIGFDRL